MKRKVVQQGEGAHTVSLPINWVRENNITKHDYVEIAQTKHGLFIRPTKEEKSDCVCTISSEREYSIRATLYTLYRFGYSKITLHTTTQKQREIIQKTTEVFFADLTYSAEENTVTITRVVSAENQNARSCVRKMMFLLQVIFEEFIESIETGAMHIEKITEYKLQHNQLDCLCRCACIDEKNFKQHNSIILYLSGYMQLIVHSLHHLATRIHAQKDFSFSSKNKTLFLQLHKCFTEITEGIFGKETTKIDAADAQLCTFLEEILVKLQVTQGFDAVVLYYAAEISRLLHIFCAHALSYASTSFDS